MLCARVEENLVADEGNCMSWSTELENDEVYMERRAGQLDWANGEEGWMAGGGGNWKG